MGSSDVTPTAIPWWPFLGADASAENGLGVCYANGKGVEQDNREAAKWYQKATAKGLAGAEEALKLKSQSGQ